MTSYGVWRVLRIALGDESPLVILITHGGLVEDLPSFPLDKSLPEPCSGASSGS